MEVFSSEQTVAMYDNTKPTLLASQSTELKSNIYRQWILQEATSGRVEFGSQCRFDLPNTVPFISQIGLEIQLPSILKSDGTFAAYCNGVGHAIIEKLEFRVENDALFEYNSQALDVHYEYFNRTEQLDISIGRTSNVIQTRQLQTTPLSLFVPIPNPFNTVETALSRYLCSSTQLCIIIKLRHFDDIIVYDGAVAPLPDQGDLNLILHYETFKVPSTLLVPEHRIFTATVFNTEQTFDIFAGDMVNECQLDFRGVSQGLFFVFYTKTSLEQNDYFNYSRRTDQNPLIHSLELVAGRVTLISLTNELPLRQREWIQNKRQTDRYIYYYKLAPGGFDFSASKDIFLRLKTNFDADGFLSVYSIKSQFIQIGPDNLQVLFAQ